MISQPRCDAMRCDALGRLVGSSAVRAVRVLRSGGKFAAADPLLFKKVRRATVRWLVRWSLLRVRVCGPCVAAGLLLSAVS